MILKLKTSREFSRDSYTVRDKLDGIVDHIRSQMMVQAHQLCMEQADTGDKAYERGYVRGIQAVIDLIIDGVAEGQHETANSGNLSKSYLKWSNA